MKKIIAVCLCLIALCSLPISVYASSIKPYYNNVDRVNTTLTISSSGVGYQVNMRMVAFIMKSGKPTEVAHGYPQVFGECLRLRPEHIPPSAAVIVAEAFGVLTAK